MISHKKTTRSDWRLYLTARPERCFRLGREGLIKGKETLRGEKGRDGGTGIPMQRIRQPGAHSIEQKF